MALNRPAFMSSVLNDPTYGGEFSASKAVDSNSDPVALKLDNSCSMTLRESNPWWAVDLGALVAVGSVLFTNTATDLGTVTLLLPDRKNIIRSQCMSNSQYSRQHYITYHRLGFFKSSKF